MCAKIINASGIITKTERVESFEPAYFTSRIATVLKTLDPFPGIKSVKPEDKPLYLYILIKPAFGFKEIGRAAEYLESEFTGDYDAAVGSIAIGDYTYPMLRIKSLAEMNLLSQLIFSLINQGLEMAKLSGNVDEEVFLTIKKFFYLEQVAEDLFIDMSEAHKGYFIPLQTINAQELIDLWNNFPGRHMYDFASGEICRKGQKKQIIRIYSPGLNLKKLKQVQQYFNDNLRE